MIVERTIAIFGPGLLGGSLALAVQERMPGTVLRLWARRESAEAGIRARGIQADFFTDAAAAAAGASLIILCTPVETMAALAEQITQGQLADDCLVTDVGSVKGSVVRALHPILGPRFIGSHPMAGSEKTGIEVARADLFQNATCLLTPEGQENAGLLRLQNFWQALGCRVLEMSPEEHDEKVARISHLPHMMAAVTTLAALRTDPSAVACVANGFRDTTRVAGGDPGLWTGIAMENRPALVAQLRAAADTLTELLEILDKPDEEELRRFLAEAQSLRRTVPAAVS
ncbi:prephenate dehydrogenase/arogenate dehydrogenase family protein [Prosthecobacter algae]|uniref:Prephenate dehydrogenase/arogenate dehydrogenase family protein n=1 Tax=Prosthecobacter algae TaxID=1144682 RepID=A0ABP9P0M6_9BACT